MPRGRRSRRAASGGGASRPRWRARRRAQHVWWTSVDLPDPLTPVTDRQCPQRNGERRHVLQVEAARAAHDSSRPSPCASLLRARASRARRAGAARWASRPMHDLGRRPRDDLPTVPPGVPVRCRSASRRRAAWPRRARRRRPCCPRPAAGRSAPRSRPWSRGCRPIEGSSRTYSTPCKPGAELGGQTDALRLATRERVGRAIEGQVAEPHVDQEPEPAVGSRAGARAAMRASRVSESFSPEARDDSSDRPACREISPMLSVAEAAPRWA